MLVILLLLLLSELGAVDHGKSHSRGHAKNHHEKISSQGNVCNMTLCGSWYQDCIAVCTCPSDWCFCCAPCLVCLDNGTKWFDCCACYDLC
uniref:Uncharacterized protein n=1 Tax=viral metagenome TaxID=1070528 RepID=A0A6C0C9R7_9ZZZZ